MSIQNFVDFQDWLNRLGDIIWSDCSSIWESGFDVNIRLSRGIVPNETMLIINTYETDCGQFLFGVQCECHQLTSE